MFTGQALLYLHVRAERNCLCNLCVAPKFHNFPLRGNMTCVYRLQLGCGVLSFFPFLVLDL